MPLSKVKISLHTDTFILDGELMMPMKEGPVPLVILVHGSGPLDMDETIGPNKVFYDLALGLAARGIATYRYEKRSKAYPEFFKGQFDIYDETVTDALNAIRFFNTDSLYKFSKIVALGHSLGAFAMPMIADSAKGLDAAILFSGNAGRIEDLLVYQIKYLSALDGDTSKYEQKAIDDAIIRSEKIRNGNYSNETPASELAAYWPGSFWSSIAQYNQCETAKQLQLPLFIMQPEKDYQIPMSNFIQWKEVLQHNSNVSFKTYPGLTHLFTPTQSELPGPADYFIPGNVDYQCIQDIAAWVKALP